MRNHAELNFHTAAMGGGKTLELLVAKNQLKNKVPTFITKPFTDNKAGDSVRTRLGDTEHETDFIIFEDTDIGDAVHEQLLKHRRKFGSEIVKRTPYIFVDEGQFLSSDHVHQMRELANDDFAHFEVYGLRTDFKNNFFPGSLELMRLADRIETLNPAHVDYLCNHRGCTRLALNNVRFIGEEVALEGDQVAIDGEQDISYEAWCGKHFFDAHKTQQTR